MTSHHSTSSSEEEEDFGPVLPGMHPTAQSTQQMDTIPGDSCDSPPLKRERHNDPAVKTFYSAQSTAPLVPQSPATPAVSFSEEETDRNAWERYTRQHLPSAALYERSFQHTTLQDTYDALTAHPDKTVAAAVTAAAVHDSCVYNDPLGALIATVDAAGIVRVWRKLPRGVFFITELDKIFPRPRNSVSREAHGGKEGEEEEEVESGPRYHSTYWAHAYTILQLLVFACVEEEIIEASEVPKGEDAAVSRAVLSPRTVRVHLRQVNPVTFTVEERRSFSFQTPVQPVATLTAVETPAAAATHLQKAQSPVQHSSTLPYALAYTRRPVFLVHQYAPHIAFFVSLPSAAVSTANNSGSQGAAGGIGGNGVVLCPCFSTLQTGNRISAQRTHASSMPLYVPTRLSVANPIAQCMQQTVGLERSGTAPCVLVDTAGIIDYCTIEVQNGTAASGFSSSPTTSSGLTLKIIAGLAAVPAASPEARLWRQWISFDRRQRTGFFSLHRDAQEALKQRQDSTESSPAAATATADVQVMPACLQLTPDGKYVVVWSTRILRTTLAAPPAQHSRIPSTQRSYRVTVESCLHLLEFSTGACVGRYNEALSKDVVEGGGMGVCTENISVRTAEWATYVHLRSRALAMQLHVEQCSAAEAPVSASAPSKAQQCYYVMVPEVPCVQLLCGSSSVLSRKVVEAECASASVDGRQIRVYEMVLPDEAASTAGVVPSSVIRRLSHGPGELESLVRQHNHFSLEDVGLGHNRNPPFLLRAALLQFHLASHEEAIQRRGSYIDIYSNSTSATTISTRLGEGFQAVCRAPLLLLRRAVAPSQDLKNLIASAPLGLALGAEARKQLFLTSSSTDSAEAVLLTTSLEPDMTSLLAYSCELPFSGLAMQRFLSKSPQVSWGCANASNVEADHHHQGLNSHVEENNGRTNADGQQQEQQHLQEERQQLWSKLCLDLHRERDYACGALLMTTVDPPPGSASTNTVAEMPQTTSTRVTLDADHLEMKEREGETAVNAIGKATSAVTINFAASPVSPVMPNSPEAFVVNLLKDVVPQLSAPTTKLPVALVHVRGYGTVRVHLLPYIAPLATDNFTRLARRHYYDRLTFHRVIPHVIVQGGCPRGDGTGGESAFEDGAPFKDEALYLFPFFSHTAEKRCCWLCMANAGPDTNGSQFFFTVPGGEAMPWLNGHHTVFGFAVDGLDVVRAVSLAVRDEEDKPLSPVVIERVDILSG